MFKHLLLEITQFHILEMDCMVDYEHKTVFDIQLVETKGGEMTVSTLSNRELYQDNKGRYIIYASNKYYI